MPTEIKTAPYDIGDMIALAKEQAAAQPQPEAPISLDEAAALYDPQEFSEALVLNNAPNRQAPRSNELRANVAADQTIEVTTPSLLEEVAPVDVSKQGIMGRIKNRMTRARQSLKSIFDTEKPVSAEKATRRKALASVVGSVAVGLVMVAAVPSANPNTAIESSAKTVTTIAHEIRTPKPANAVAKATQQSLSDQAKVTQFVTEHPQEAKDFFTWISTTKAQNPAITDAQMSQQFHEYTKTKPSISI